MTTHSGLWRMRLGSRRRSRIAFTYRGRGRPLGLSPSLVRALAGSATRVGSVVVTSRGPGCAGPIRRLRCPRKRVAFTGALARLTAPRAGLARFSALARVSAVRSFRGSCPQEPADIRALRTDLRLADAPLSAADVFDRSVPRFFISGNTTRKTTIEGEYDGKVTEHVRWTLSFTRVG